MAERQPNYVNPQNHGTGVVTGGAILASITLIAVLARLWSRFRILHQPGLDDLFIIISFVFAMAYYVLGCIAMTNYGYNRSVYDFEAQHVLPGSRLIYFQNLFRIFDGGCARLSVLLLYRRLFATAGNATYRWINWGLIIFIAATTLTFTGLFVFNCLPIEAYWMSYDPSFTKKWHCMKSAPIALASTIIFVISDILIALFPCPIVARLQMPLKKKLMVIFVLILGFFACFAGVMRLHYVRLQMDSVDYMWYIYPTFVWTLIELFMTIFCACIPALTPMFRQYMGKGSRLHQYLTKGSSAQVSAGAYTGSANSKQSKKPSIVASYPLENTSFSDKKRSRDNYSENDEYTRLANDKQELSV